MFLPLNRVLSASEFRFRTLIAIFSAIFLVYGVLSFLGHDPLQRVYDMFLLGSMARVLSAIMLIGLIVVASRLLEQIHFLRRVGQESLYLCGGEYIFKAFLIGVATLLGLRSAIATPFGSTVFCCVTMVLCFLVFPPVGKRLNQLLRYLNTRRAN